MPAPLTIEQMILNHAIGVNLSDAATLGGLTPDKYAKTVHSHSASDIISGVFSPSRLPIATSTANGVVTLSSSTDSDAQNLAATPYAVKAVKNIAIGKADSHHYHDPIDMRTGTFTSILAATSTDAVNTRQIRSIIISTSAPNASTGSDGDIYFQYE